MDLKFFFLLFVLLVSAKCIAVEEYNINDSDIRELKALITASNSGSFISIEGVSSYCPCGNEHDCRGSANISVDQGDNATILEFVKTSKGWALSEMQKWRNESARLFDLYIKAARGEKIDKDIQDLLRAHYEKKPQC